MYLVCDLWRSYKRHRRCYAAIRRSIEVRRREDRKIQVVLVLGTQRGMAAGYRMRYRGRWYIHLHGEIHSARDAQDESGSVSTSLGAPPCGETSSYSL